MVMIPTMPKPDEAPQSDVQPQMAAEPPAETPVAAEPPSIQDVHAAASPIEPPRPPAMAPTPPGGATRVRRQRMSSGGRWALALVLTVLGGLSWVIVGLGLAGSIMSGNTLMVIVFAGLPALTCLAAAWLLRSWWGLGAAAVVYVAVTAVMWPLVGAATILSSEFALYVVVPAVVLSVIGTAIGMYRAR